MYSKTEILLFCRAELMLVVLMLHIPDNISMKYVNGFGIPSKIDAYWLFFFFLNTSD